MGSSIDVIDHYHAGSRMMDLKLPFWLREGELAKLANAARAWWDRVEAWLRWPMQQADALTAVLPIVDLLAWQRDITRFVDEPEALYRKRVKFALANARDAGSVAGFIAIFDRLEIGYVEIDERFDVVDWDLVKVRLSDQQLASNTDLLLSIVRKYGRTCRRYQFETITPVVLQIDARWTGAEYWLDVAEL